MTTAIGQGTRRGTVPRLSLDIDGNRVSLADGARSMELYLAVDRPDRLEAELLLDAATTAAVRVGVPAVLYCDRPGAPIDHQDSARFPAFAGTLTRAGCVLDVERGRLTRIVAYAPYYCRRQELRERSFSQVTVSEIAHEVARELGLTPVIDPVRDVEECVRVPADRLTFLRERSKQLGFHLAVTGGRLYFVAAVPEPPTSVRILPRDVVALDASHDLIRGVSGTVDLAVASVWRPLTEVFFDEALLEKTCFTSKPHAPYRVERAVHRVGADGWRVRLEFR